MKKSLPFFVLLSFLGIAVPASALKVQSSIPNKGVFGIRVDGTNQSYYGRTERISSVSLQEYTTGALLVTEVVIDLEFANQALRIYTTRPMSSGDVAERTKIPGATVPANPVERSAQRAAQKAIAGFVVKTYPVTTHAKMTEISVGSTEEVLDFYNKFSDLWAGNEVSTNASGVTSSDKTRATGAAGAPSMMTVNRVGGVLFVIE